MSNGNSLLSGLMIQPRKRKVFFSFHYADIMRVNNVRKCGEFKSKDAWDAGSREIEGFYDFSLWESKKLEGPEALKRMIRVGVEGTSTVCVLVGTQTYARPWVRYEIARSVIDDRGLLAAHLNNISHHVEKRAHALGPNPLSFMGVYKYQAGPLSMPLYYLAEVNEAGRWIKYAGYTNPVNKPRYLPEPYGEQVMPLSSGARIYDFASDQGHRFIGAWIDQAAQAVGR